MNNEQQIGGYLSSLSSNLKAVTIIEREEILQEISAHIRDSAEESGASIDTVLARLGPAEELAAQYCDELLIRRASRSVSPVLLLRATLRLASKGVFAILIFFCGLFGYLFGGALALTVLFKCISPAHTGMWVRNGHLGNLGTMDQIPPPPWKEILGWSYIPLALVLVGVILLLTTTLIRWFLRASQHLNMKVSVLFVALILTSLCPMSAHWQEEFLKRKQTGVYPVPKALSERTPNRPIGYDRLVINNRIGDRR